MKTVANVVAFLLKGAASSIAVSAALLVLDVNPSIVSILGSVCLIGLLLIAFQLAKHHLESSISGGFEDEDIAPPIPPVRPSTQPGKRYNPITDRINR